MLQFLLFIYFQKARLSVRILQYRTRVTDELILERLLCRKTLKKRFSSPPMMRFSRFSGMKMQQLLVVCMGKFTSFNVCHMRSATAALSNVSKQKSSILNLFLLLPAADVLSLSLSSSFINEISLCTARNRYQKYFEKV